MAAVASIYRILSAPRSLLNVNPMNSIALTGSVFPTNGGAIEGTNVETVPMNSTAKTYVWPPIKSDVVLEVIPIEGLSVVIHIQHKDVTEFSIARTAPTKLDAEVVLQICMSAEQEIHAIAK